MKTTYFNYERGPEKPSTLQELSAFGMTQLASMTFEEKNLKPEMGASDYARIRLQINGEPLKDLIESKLSETGIELDAPAQERVQAFVTVIQEQLADKNDNLSYVLARVLNQEGLAGILGWDLQQHFQQGGNCNIDLQYISVNVVTPKSEEFLVGAQSDESWVKVDVVVESREIRSSESNAALFASSENEPGLITQKAQFEVAADSEINPGGQGILGKSVRLHSYEMGSDSEVALPVSPFQFFEKYGNYVQQYNQYVDQSQTASLSFPQALKHYQEKLRQNTLRNVQTCLDSCKKLYNKTGFREHAKAGSPLRGLFFKVAGGEQKLRLEDKKRLVTENQEAFDTLKLGLEETKDDQAFYRQTRKFLSNMQSENTKLYPKEDLNRMLGSDLNKEVGKAIHAIDTIWQASIVEDKHQANPEKRFASWALKHEEELTSESRSVSFGR